jgi:hypothetical protein
MLMAKPLGTTTVSPGSTGSGAEMQARKSMAAEPLVAYDGSGMLVPSSGFMILVSIL